MSRVANAYEIANLTKIYSGSANPALDDVSMTIPTGIIFGILGPNGAGKTTLVRQLAGLLRPSSGSIHVLGNDVVREPEMAPYHVAYYGQKVQAFHAFRFSEVLWMTGMFRGMSVKDASQQAKMLLDRFEAEDLSAKIIGRISGGEGRLAGILASFMGERPILILDEPTNDLDPVRRKALWDYLHERNAKHGATVIVVSHNLAELETVAHQAALINKGRVLAAGTLGEMKRAVANKVRLEFRFRREPGGVPALMEGLEVSQVRPGVWAVYTEPAAASHLLQRLLDTVGTETLDDFRLITPTLDDVYLHFTRGEGVQ